jgi:hypothetical protein
VVLFLVVSPSHFNFQEKKREKKRAKKGREMTKCDRGWGEK